MPNYLDTSAKVEAIGSATKAETLEQGNLAVEEVPGKSKSSRSIPLGNVENPYMLGQKGSHTRKLGVLQNFDVLRAEHSSSNLFEDTEFPAEPHSILPEDMRDGAGFKLLSKVLDQIKWLRPKDIVSSAKFFVNGSTRFDIKQRAIGDCWFLSSLAALADRPDLLSRVVPNCHNYMKDNGDSMDSKSPIVEDCESLYGDNYAGIFHFRFWQSGSWVDVVIDDRLPTFYGHLLFAEESSGNEFWCALVEKAYAKLYGSYAELDGGYPFRAMEDLTGGTCCEYYLDNDDFDLVETVIEAQKRKALIVFGSLSGDTEFEADQEEKSISMNHAYSCTKYFRENRRNWFKLRNPWGQGEWSGIGGDDWVQKHRPNRSLKEDWIDFKKDEDGEFLLQRDDLHFYFQCVDICYVDSVPTSHDTDDASWSETRYVEALPGQWVSGKTAGGPQSDKEGSTFSTNPRYRVTLGSSIFDSGLHQVTVGLRQNVLQTEGELLSTGFSVFKVNSGSERAHIRTRFAPKARKIIQLRLKLEDGTYEIVPFTGEPGQPGKFFLRVASDHPITLKDLSTAPVENNGGVSNIYDGTILRLVTQINTHRIEFTPCIYAEIQLVEQDTEKIRGSAMN